MELSSALLHKGQLPWRGLLLAASLLIYWSSPTTAQVIVEAVPPHVAEGANVLLLVHNLTETPLVFYWHKGENPDNSNEIARFILSDNANTAGPAYSGRETIYPNGSLLFENVTQNDTGAYTLQMVMQSFDRTKVSVQFHVHPPLPKPSITSNNPNPMEGEDSVAFMCEPETENTNYLWRRNGQSLSEGDRLKLSEDNRTLTLLSVVRNDTGPYECETRNPVSTSRSDPFTLNITYGPDVPIISPSNTHFHSRRNLSLSCQAASNPPALYSWFVNGELLSSPQELFIPNITTNDSGTYTCFVYNSVTGLNKTTVKNITVLEPVTTPSIQVGNTTVKVLDSVSLNCSSNDTRIYIHWLFNGQSLELTDRMKLSLDNSTLNIDPVKREDSGEYQCEVSNPVSSERSDSIQLDIIEPVTTPSIQVGNTTVKELDSVSLTCSSNNTGISIHWLFNGQSLELTDRMELSQNNSNLSIDPVKREDSGKYQCEVSNPVSSERSDSIYLAIIEPVTTPSIQVGNTTVKVLDSVSLNCSSNNTGISIHWLFNGQSLELTDRMKLSLDNSTLSIDPVKREDSGEYQCEVSNPVSSERSDSIYLAIIEPVTTPFIQVGNTTVKVLDSVSLNCSSNNTGISIHWLFNGQSLELTDRMKLSLDNSTLSIDPVKREDSGEYQCEVSNPVSSERSDSIQLDIIEPVTTPFIQVGNTTVKELDSVSLTCSSNDTGISIHWLFNGQSLELTDRMKLSLDNSTLSIDPVKREDSGEYQCEVSNPVSSERSDSIYLAIIEPVTTPFIQVGNTTVKVLDSVSLNCSSNNTGISIHWLFNGQSLELTDRMKLSLDNSTLSIDPVKREDSGEYQCEVSNPVSSERSDSIQLDIIEPVTTPFIQVGNTTVKELDSVSLTCSSNDTGISIHWLFNGQSLELTDRMKLSLDNSTLSIDPVKREDSGEYQCEVSNPVSSERSDSIYLAIIEPVTTPFIQVGNTTVKVLDSVSLNCSSNNTGISIHWLFNGQSLELTDRMKLSLDNSTLSIDPVKREDSGEYQCEVSNPVSSERSDSIQLDIIEPVTTPSIHVGNTTVKVLDSVSLTCSSNDTGISIHWLFNGQNLELTDRMNLSLDNSTLSIDPVKWEDSGEYQCEVSNPVSSERSDSIYLAIIEPVTTPSIQIRNTTVKELDSVSLNCSSNNTGISIHWLFNGQSLELTDRMKLSLNNSILSIDPVKRADSGEYQCEVSNPVSSKRSDPIHLTIIADTTQGSSGLSGGAIAGIVVGSVAGVTLIAALAYFLCF
ncbi:carcinoembryonic antigen-related cell adhesion molecule 5-like isoform X2 [Microtus oregoni]|uniref:carcinoembryonic antigen-related cell adhesion molecule 5-like isoform X2 n=1 Tax=Microtus oregoni TaxID=111838 RepID=UPI001BB25FDC|nr:carcinoembryonic antigen-related cell adhesion molecule 5-like isoform X2 [Microtus oregoni]